MLGSASSVLTFGPFCSLCSPCSERREDCFFVSWEPYLLILPNAALVPNSSFTIRTASFPYIPLALSWFYRLPILAVWSDMIRLPFFLFIMRIKCVHLFRCLGIQELDKCPEVTVLPQSPDSLFLVPCAHAALKIRTT